MKWILEENCIGHMIIDKKGLIISHVPISWFAGEEGGLTFGLAIGFENECFWKD